MPKARRRWHQHIQPARGKFAPWVTIGHGGKDRTHKMACCDCALVHDEQFEVYASFVERGKTVWRKLDARKIKIRRRVRRNAKSTAMMRRHKENEE